MCRLVPGIGLALFVAGMIINGSFLISDIPLQESVNGEAVNDGGSDGADFSALLFLILATPVAQGSHVKGDAEGSLTEVSCAGGSNADAAYAEGAHLHDVKHDVGDFPVQPGNPETVDLRLAGNSGQLPTTVIAPAETSNPEPVTATTATEESQGARSDIPRDLTGSENAVAEAMAHRASAIVRPEVITAALPKELFPSNQTAAADNASGALKNKGNVSQPSFEFPLQDDVAAMDTAAKTWSSHAPSEQTDPRQGRGIPLGHSIYAKDNRGQAASVLAREPTAPDDGGIKLGHHLLQTQTEGEPRGRTLSEMIHTIGETHSSNPNHGEQGAFFQHGDHEASHEPAQAPFEIAQHNGVPFHVARLTDNGLSAARGAEPAQWRPVVEQVAGEIKGQIRIGKTEAVIQLDPPELGELKIDLHLEGDKLEARIFAKTEESRMLIETHLAELRQVLGEYRVELVDVRIDNGSWGSARGDGHQGQRQEAGGGRQSAGEFVGTARGGPEERELVRRQPAAQESGRVSMWA